MAEQESCGDQVTVQIMGARLWAFAVMAFPLMPLFADPCNCAISQMEQTWETLDQPPSENKNILDFSLYHPSDQLLQDISALVSRHPLIMTEKVWRSSVIGYSAEMPIVTVELGGRKPNFQRKLRILLNFGQHGRELVTTEVALRLLKILAGEHELRDQNMNSFRQVLTNMVLKVVPMENVNGRKKVEGGAFCERKNGRGVDTNRNWGVDWGKKEKDYDPYEEYPGTAAFSEPETQILREVATSFKPHLWVNVHSGMQALLMPYDHKHAMPEPSIAKPVGALLETLNTLHCKRNCTVGSGGASVGYLAHGTATDYMHATLKVPVALTFEIYGNLDVDKNDCYAMFNPTTRSDLESTIMNWCEAFLTIFMQLPSTLGSILKAKKMGLLNSNFSGPAIPVIDVGTQHQVGVIEETTNKMEDQVFWRPNEENSVFLRRRYEEDSIVAEFFYLIVGLGSVIGCVTVVKQACLWRDARHKSLHQIV